MTLIVEDGTGVADANSYNSLDDLRTWALARGYDLSDPTVTDEALEVFATKSMDFLESLRDKLAGRVSVAGQRLSWPRECLWYEGDELAGDVIPVRWKDAQAQLVVYASQGIELQPIITGQSVKFLVKQKLGPIEREYSEAAYLASMNTTPLFYTVSDMIRPFLRNGSRQLPVSRA